MFDKLRHRFTAMNMLVISLMMVAAFCVVYVLVYTNIQQQAGEELNALMSMADGRGKGHGQQNMPNGAFVPDGLDLPEPPAFAEDGTFPDDAAFPEMSAGEQESFFAHSPRIGFVVITGAGSQEILLPGFMINEDEFDVAAMVGLAQQAARPSGSFNLGDYNWRYQTKTMPDGTVHIAFLESSESRVLLRNLIWIFAGVAVVLLAVIYVVSRWFARRSIAPIEEAYNNQRRFIQDASHELKTPVAVFKTNLEALNAEPEATVASQKDWITNMQAETAHMEHLTKTLLTLAKAEAETPDAPKEPFSLSDAVQSSILPMEAVLYEKKLDFTSHVEENIQITGSPQDIQRLVHILMENAIQYTPEGGTISLALAAQKRRATLMVANSGPGIPAEELPHVFQRFYRADKTRARSGSYGLGLSIAEGIVHRHGGTIAAASVPGRQTTFTVTLPVG